MRDKLALTIALASFAVVTALGVGMAGADPLGTTTGTTTTAPTGLSTTPLPSVQTPACSNGIDDDGDGLVDMADPDCASPTDNSEAPTPPAPNPSEQPPSANSTLKSNSTLAPPQGQGPVSHNQGIEAPSSSGGANGGVSFPAATAGSQIPELRAKRGHRVLQRWLPHRLQPDRDDRQLRPGPDRRPQLRHRLLRDPALPAADLPGLRHRVRDPLGGARLDQQNRDGVRHQPERLQRRRRRLDAVPSIDLADLRSRRQRRRAQGPIQPGRCDLRSCPLPEGGRRQATTSTTRSSPTTTPTGTRRRCWRPHAPTASCPPTWSARSPASPRVLTSRSPPTRGTPTTSRRGRRCAPPLQALARPTATRPT